MNHLRRLAGTALRGLVALTLIASLSACYVGLHSGLSEQEANEIVAALMPAGIAADKERADNNQWQVSVDKGDLAAALDVLRAQGLPNDRYASMGDLFQKQGLISTPSEERMRYIYAVSQELSQTLRTIDGVVAARVHVVIPASDPLSEKVRPSSAAVFIKHRADVDLRLLAPAVKDLVAHSIEGLAHDQVALSLFEARKSAVVAAVAPANPVAAMLPSRTVLILLALLVAAAGCLALLPRLLRRENIDWRTWVRQQWLRR